MLKRNKKIVKILSVAICMELLAIPCSSTYATDTNKYTESLEYKAENYVSNPYQAVDSNGIKWSYYAERGQILSITLYEKPNTTSIEVPKELNGCPVLAIGSYAFRDIGNELTSIKIPSTVTSIGDYAFNSCSKLTDIDIPSSVENIGCHVFDGTPYLTKKQSESSLVIINDILVDGKKATGDITIPSNISSIADGAFTKTALTSIEPGAQHFDDYSKITSVSIPSSVISIGKGAFSECPNLKDITIPSSVQRIEDYAFYKCPELKKVVIEGNDSIPCDSAFASCEKLSDVEMPSSLNILDIHDIERAFNNTPWMNSHYNDSTGLQIVNGVLVDGTNAEGDVVIPSTVTSISYNAFKDSNKITSVTIPSSVKLIEGYAFYGCTNLNTLKISDGLEDIRNKAFDECPALKTVYCDNEYCKNYFKDKNIDIKSYSDISNNSTNNNNKNNNNASNVIHNASASDQGLKFENNEWYYKDSQGNNYTGWLNLNGKTLYFYGNGTMATNFVNLGGSYFYFDPTPGNNMGNLVTGWKKVNGSWYYFSPQADNLGNKGTMQTGWLYLGGTWYYFYSEGIMATGFVDLGGGAVYYLYPYNNSYEGSMLTGWQKINGSWYYFNPVNNSNGYEGMMQRGWRYINGEWYYLYSNGVMAANTWVDNYYVNGSGAWVSTR